MERGNVHLSPGSFVPFGALWNLQREEKARKVTGDAAVTLVHTLSPTVRSLRASPPALALCPRNTDSLPIKRFLQLLVSLASKGNASPAAWSMRAASKSGGGLNPGKDKLSHVTTPGTAWQFSETKTRIICCPGDAVCASCNPPETRQCSQGQHSQRKQNGDRWDRWEGKRTSSSHCLASVEVKQVPFCGWRLLCQVIRSAGVLTFTIQSWLSSNHSHWHL